MDAPVITDPEKPAEDAMDFNLAALTMETVEFELALQLRATPGKSFDAVVTEALASVGGKLLFEMPAESNSDGGPVAAVSLPGYDSRILALVTRSPQGELRVEAAERSVNPVARIVAAYAGLMDCLAP